MGEKIDALRDAISVNHDFVQRIVEDSSMFDIEGYEVQRWCRRISCSSAPQTSTCDPLTPPCSRSPLPRCARMY